VIPLVAPVESNGPYRHLRVTPLNSRIASAASASGAATGASAAAAVGATPVTAGATPDTRRDIRRHLRACRAALTPGQRSAAAHAIAAHVAGTRWLRGARPVGLYVSIGTEVPTGALRALAEKRNCPVYLPCIVDYRYRRMVFARDAGAPSSINRLGIPEPDALQTIAARALSVVLLPVLGFDPYGTRLGTGGGYYDRMFAFRRHRQSWHRPLLVGIAFQCQQLPLIERGSHDVPLDAVVTEAGITLFTAAAA
jgi:5-formyltetrahydrofolate cyclo-ligase